MIVTYPGNCLTATQYRTVLRKQFRLFHERLPMSMSIASDCDSSSRKRSMTLGAARMRKDCNVVTAGFADDFAGYRSRWSAAFSDDPRLGRTGRVRRGFG